jgi:hypothetical protein
MRHANSEGPIKVGSSLYRKMEVHTYLLIYLFTPRSRVLLEKLTGSQLVKKFPSFYGTQRCITAFTSARHLSLSWARSIQYMPTHPTSWRSIVILSSHLRLVFPSSIFPSGFPTKTLYAPLLSPKRATCPVHLILDLITQTIFGEEYTSLSSSFCSFLHSPVTSSLSSASYSQTPSAYVTHSMWATKFHTLKKKALQPSKRCGSYVVTQRTVSKIWVMILSVDCPLNLSKDMSLLVRIR